MPDQEQCAFKGCDCDVDSTSFKKEGKSYCSEECSKDKGCGHPGCACTAKK